MQEILSKILLIIGLKQTPEQIMLNHLRKIQVLIDNYPTDKTAWLSKGIVFTDLKRYKEAVECFNKVIELDPDKSEYYYDAAIKKGLVLFNIGYYEESINCFDICLEKNLFNSSAWFNKGIALSRIDRHHEAITLFDKMAIVNADDPLVWLGKSTIFAALGKFEDAEECYQKAHLPL